MFTVVSYRSVFIRGVNIVRNNKYSHPQLIDEGETSESFGVPLCSIRSGDLDNE